MVINLLLYVYLFSCFALFIFNLLYMILSSFLNKRRHQKCSQYETQIMNESIYLQTHSKLSISHERYLLKRLRNINDLIAFNKALDHFEKKSVEPYLTQLLPIWQQLAVSYLKKDNMKKAFFAYVISKHGLYYGKEYRPLMQLLLQFLDHSTIYCRENVFKALCTLGNIQAIENMMNIINDKEWFHHQKLVADNLSVFQGDQELLMTRLWQHVNEWNDHLMVAVVQFISQKNGNFQQIFLPYLRSPQTSLEVRLAMIRYYRLHPYEPVREILYSFIDDTMIQDVSLTIVSAFALDHYPGNKTIELLKKALCHHNWYVRRNAAASLVHLKVAKKDLKDIYEGKDPYAKEILTYMYKKQEV